MHHQHAQLTRDGVLIVVAGAAAADAVKDADQHAAVRQRVDEEGVLAAKVLLFVREG